MTGLEPLFIPLLVTAARPVIELATYGIKKCWHKCQKKQQKQKKSAVGSALEATNSIIEDLCNELAATFGENFLQGDCTNQSLASKFRASAANMSLAKARKELYLIQLRLQSELQKSVEQALELPGDDPLPTQRVESRLGDGERDVTKVLLALAGRLFPNAKAVVEVEPGAAPTAEAAIQKLRQEQAVHGRPTRPNLGVAQLQALRYCPGAVSLQKNQSRTVACIADPQGDGGHETYRCKFCCLYIAHEGMAPFTPFDWACLARSHVVASDSLGDSRAKFRCLDCSTNPYLESSPAKMLTHIKRHLEKPELKSAYRHQTGFPATSFDDKEFQQYITQLDTANALAFAELEAEFQDDPEVLEAQRDLRKTRPSSNAETAETPWIETPTDFASPAGDSTQTYSQPGIEMPTDFASPAGDSTQTYSQPGIEMPTETPTGPIAVEVSPPMVHELSATSNWLNWDSAEYYYPQQTRTPSPPIPLIPGGY
ncbi:hypothetical protein H2202_001311 [Exophiala xenobiotica]|nr:hypothetical protein H2202_001311 [Exophiala xenobiotica]